DRGLGDGAVLGERGEPAVDVAVRELLHRVDGVGVGEDALDQVAVGQQRLGHAAGAVVRQLGGHLGGGGGGEVGGELGRGAHRIRQVVQGLLRLPIGQRLRGIHQVRLGGAQLV